MEKIKICCFSDTHSVHRAVKLPKCDVAIFAGDCMGSGYKKSELVDFLGWYNSQSIKYKIMIAGNHDRYIEDHPIEFRRLLDNNFTSLIYLDQSSTIIEGIHIYGIPHTKIFHNWAFNRSEEELKRIFQKIPQDVQILVTHGPQYEFLDTVGKGEHLGEETLWEALMTKGYDNLQLLISGHIHDSYGITMGMHWDGEESLAPHIAINASICNEEYEPVNSPIVYYYYK